MSRTNQFWCRTEDVRTRKEKDPTADRWSGDGKANSQAPPAVETEHYDDRNARQGKQDQEASGEVEKTGVVADCRKARKTGER